MIKTILVIDDSPADQLLAQITIEAYNPDIKVLQAQDGQEGLDILASTTDSIDVILLDINMPGLDGYGFLEKYHQANYQACVVTMLTSSLLDRDRERCSDYSFVRQYIVKPLEVSDLEALERELAQ